MRNRIGTSKRKALILFLACLLAVISATHGRAEDQKPKDEIPEYFLTPEGPFKDKQAFEKALAAQNSPWWPHMNLPMKRTRILYEACKKDLEDSGSDYQQFLPTKCGLLMQGYADASMVMFYTLMDGIGVEAAAKFAKQKPFCLTENINIMDIANTFVSHIEQNPKKLDGNTYHSISTALTNKYPCPWRVERKNNR